MHLCISIFLYVVSFSPSLKDIMGTYYHPDIKSTNTEMNSTRTVHL